MAAPFCLQTSLRVPCYLKIQDFKSAAGLPLPITCLLFSAFCSLRAPLSSAGPWLCPGSSLLWALDVKRFFPLGPQGTSLWCHPSATRVLQAAAASQDAGLSPYALAYLASLLQFQGSVFSTSPLPHKQCSLLSSSAGQWRVGGWDRSMWTRAPLPLVPNLTTLGKLLPCLELQFPHLK